MSNPIQLSSIVAMQPQISTSKVATVECPMDPTGTAASIWDISIGLYPKGEMDKMEQMLCVRISILYYSFKDIRFNEKNL